jgi:putative cardiolipin synthase
VGGRNIGNEYFWASEEMNFNDFDLWTAGPIVQNHSKEFDTYWNSPIAYPIASLIKDYKPTKEDLEQLSKDVHQSFVEAEKSQYSETLREVAKEEIITGTKLGHFWGTADVLFDPISKFTAESTKDLKTLKTQLRPIVDQVKKELILISPYFVPRKDGMKFFKVLGDRGVTSLVLTNSLASSDVTSVFSGYKGSRKDLLKMGVHLYELKPNIAHKVPHSKNIGSSTAVSGLHGKVMVLDRKYIFVGSMNLDPRSMEINSEMGVLVHSPELAETFARAFVDNLPNSAFRLSLNEDGKIRWTATDAGKSVELTKEPDTSWWKRFKAGFMSIFVPTSEL